MSKYEVLANKILESVGGKSNVISASHCMTRLRLNLKDSGIPNEDEIKSIKGVLGVVVSGGQYQIVIGQEVGNVYEDFCKKAGIQENEIIDEYLDKTKNKATLKSVGKSILNYLSGAVTPLIPIMLAAALFKTVSSIFGSAMLGWIADGSNLAILLDFCYEAGFYFMPIYLGYTAAKKLNTSIPLGLFLGGILIAPGFVGLVSSETPFDVYGIPCAVNNYSSTVLPVILAVWVMSYVYKFISKRMPKVLSTALTPFLTLVIMLPITLCILAPLGSFLGSYLAIALNWLGSIGGGIGVAIVGALYCFMVMTGMHSPIVLMSLTVLFSTGSDSLLFVGASAATAACCGMALGAFLRIKDKEEKSNTMGCFVTCLVSGVTEPSLYGIGLKYIRPFIGLVAGGFAGGLYAGINHVTYHVLISSTVLGIFSFSAGGTANFINGIITMVIGFIVAAVVTYFFGFGKKTNKNAQ